MVARRYEITEFEWSVIAPLLPNKPRGVPRVDDRRVLNGIFWRLRTGSPWADMLDALGEGAVLLADAGYDSDVLRHRLGACGVFANIKPTPRRVRPPAFSPWLYRHRNRVERFFNKLKHFRAVATRFEKHAANYLALVKLASIRIWLRANESVS
jgi:transposase